MPYRIDILHPPPNTLDRLVELGALDIEEIGGGVASLMPDSVTPAMLTDALGTAGVTTSAAVGRDNGSVWLLSLRTVRIGNFLIAGSEGVAPPDALRLIDSSAFGTGHHPTSVLCVEVLEEILTAERPQSILDVGTGSGVLALTALLMGVPQAVGLDIEAEALKAAAENARLNNLTERLQLVLGGPDVVDGSWPLVVANVLAAPLMEMAPILVRRVASRGRLILSGIPMSLEAEVRRKYQHFGMGHIYSRTSAGWVVLVAQASW